MSLPALTTPKHKAMASKSSPLASDSMMLQPRSENDDSNSRRSSRARFIKCKDTGLIILSIKAFADKIVVEDSKSSLLYSVNILRSDEKASVSYEIADETSTVVADALLQNNSNCEFRMQRSDSIGGECTYAIKEHLFSRKSSLKLNFFCGRQLDQGAFEMSLKSSMTSAKSIGIKLQTSVTSNGDKTIEVYSDELSSPVSFGRIPHMANGECFLLVEPSCIGSELLLPIVTLYALGMARHMNLLVSHGPLAIQTAKKFRFTF
jgi:hypothetical protein